MRLTCWMSWILLAAVLFASDGAWSKKDKTLEGCFSKMGGSRLILAENFAYGSLPGSGPGYVIFLKNGTQYDNQIKSKPQLVGKKLYLPRQLVSRDNSRVRILFRFNCSDQLNCTNKRISIPDSCQVQNLPTKHECRSSVYDESNCGNLSLTNNFIFDMTNHEINQTNCINCESPEPRKPGDNVTIGLPSNSNSTELDSAAVRKAMKNTGDVVSSLKGDSASLSGGKNMEGVVVKVEEDPDEVSFAYQLPNESMSIIRDRQYLLGFSRSVIVTKEAMEKAAAANTSVPFVAVVRFRNMAKDEKNSTVLADEILAVEMGTEIKNLSDNIKLNFKDMKYSGTPICHSWDGQGSRPNWTTEGSLTEVGENKITCQYSHLTFFAILLAPDAPIPSSDLYNLTIITQVGCGVSIFFLGLILFMHFLVRRAKATNTTKILIHLASALFMLNFTFLINSHVARLQSAVGCQAMGALTHYAMLATFSWFGAQAFHLCLQKSTNFDIQIKRYVLKVAVVCWGVPCVFGIGLLSAGKYGQQEILADNPSDNAAMCWITDPTVHYAVNVGYYAVVFLFTLSCFVGIITWLCCLLRTNSSQAQGKRNGISIGTVLSLCCMLGITWGFAFFAYGPMQIPSYYIFTILNSLQGLFLFIYYHKNRHPWMSTDSGTGGATSSSASATTTSSIGLAKTTRVVENPYCEMPGKKEP